MYYNAPHMQEDGIRSACGTDISSGHAADSGFSGGVRDPWSDDCLVTFADIAINYDDVVYPLPSDSARLQLEPDKLPDIFVRGRANGLISPLLSVTASSIQLSDNKILAEWPRFALWAESEAEKLREWRFLHSTSRDILDSHDLHVPEHVVDAVWSSIDRDSVLRVIDLDDYGLKYAFDVFVRTIQYDNVLGPARRYYAHPLREKALGDYLELKAFQQKWSWGRYLVGVMKSGIAPLDPSWFIDRVAEIRGRVVPSESYPGARWSDLAGGEPKEQHGRLEQIAADLRLPAELESWAVNSLAVAFGVGGLVTAPNYAISVILGAGAIGIGVAPRTVSGTVASIPILRGALKWRGLFSERAA